MEKIKSVDRHYNGVSNAMLVKQGVILKEINELTILREYSRIAEKERNLQKQRKIKQPS